MDNLILDVEYKFYIDNVIELTKKYREQFIVIKNQSVIGSYKTFDEAFSETTKNEQLGTFLIQKCGRQDSFFNQTFCTLLVR